MLFPYDLQPLEAIEGFTATSLLLTAAICLVAIFVAWYTVRSRIQLSQVILGVFGYVLVMLLENIFSTAWNPETMPTSGIVYGMYMVLYIVVSRELIRFLLIKFGLVDRFRDTDASIGFGLGMAGFYLFTCAAYYFNLYTVANEFLDTGAELFFNSVGADGEEAYNLLVTIGQQSGWEYLFTGLNRVFFLVREISLSVLVWYGITNEKMRRLVIVAPLMHLVAMLPEGMYAASILNNLFVKDILTYALSGGIAFVAAKCYNAQEDQVTHFKVEKLRARKRR